MASSKPSNGKNIDSHQICVGEQFQPKQLVVYYDPRELKVLKGRHVYWRTKNVQ